MWIQEDIKIDFGMESKYTLEEKDKQLKWKDTSQVAQERLIDLSQIKLYI